MLQAAQSKRVYCKSCNLLLVKEEKDTKHEDHTLKECISDEELQHPSVWLTPLDNPKKEAQFLFSETAVETLVEILENLGYR